MSIYSLPGTPASSYRVLLRFPYPMHVALFLEGPDTLLSGFLGVPHALQVLIMETLDILLGFLEGSRVLQGAGLARIHSCPLGGWRGTVCSSYNLQIPIRRDQLTTLTNFVYFFLQKVMGGWESKSWHGSLIFCTFPLQVHFGPTVCCFCLLRQELLY